MVATQTLPGDIRIATALAIVALALLTSALVRVATGWFGRGRIVRSFPQSVLAGFLAGTGWLLVIGGLSVATGLAMDDLIWPSAWSIEAGRLWPCPPRGSASWCWPLQGFTSPFGCWA